MTQNKSLTIEDIKKKVEKLLKTTGVKKLPVNIDKIARSLELEIEYQPYDEPFSGVLIRNGNEATIGVNSKHHEHRQRFTIAHEIGHYLFHQGDLMIDKTISINYRGNETVVDYQKEKEANLFASELLLPTKLLTKELKKFQIDLNDDDQIKDLAQKYNVSQQALMIRLSREL
jgi:Zn-dependent peptidase ImmA (M78 family)